MKVAITGGTGFIGRAVVRALLDRGDTAVVLTRDPFDASARLGRSGKGGESTGHLEVRAWDPGEGGAWQEHVASADAVLHLAGENIGATRLGPDLVRRARQSRIRTAELLVEAMAAEPRPRVLVSASGVGYYGARRDDHVLDEAADPGDDTLARLCVDWEAAARRAEPLGVRVVCARLGVVLDADGGALPLMAKPFRMFVGGPLGQGSQYLAWIHRDDVVRILLRCLEDETLSGPVNVTAPELVTNEQFSYALGQTLKRPSWIRVPEWALQTALGEGAEMVLGGQRAVPQKLLDAGFTWTYPRVRSALQAALR
jgi:uncharacterized protein (TIGR01777 family)